MGYKRATHPIEVAFRLVELAKRPQGCILRELIDDTGTTSQTAYTIADLVERLGYVVTSRRGESKVRCLFGTSMKPENEEDDHDHA